jgi:hypothetical protein
VLLLILAVGGLGVALAPRGGATSNDPVQRDSTVVNPIFPVTNLKFSGEVATTVELSSAGSTLAATIDWGDGTVPTFGVLGREIAEGSGSFTRSVSGTHTYTRVATFSVTVTITSFGATFDRESNLAGGQVIGERRPDPYPDQGWLTMADTVTSMRRPSQPQSSARGPCPRCRSEQQPAPHLPAAPRNRRSSSSTRGPAGDRACAIKSESSTADGADPGFRVGRGPLVSRRAADGCIARVIREPVRAMSTTPAALLLPKGIGPMLHAGKPTAGPHPVRPCPGTIASTTLASSCRLCLCHVRADCS